MTEPTRCIKHVRPDGSFYWEIPPLELPLSAVSLPPPPDCLEVEFMFSMKALVQSVDTTGDTVTVVFSETPKFEVLT